MKKIFLLLLVALPFTSFCQKVKCPNPDRLNYPKFEFGISIGNNGQLQRTLDDFYFLVDDMSNNNAVTVQNINIKLNATAKYFLTENISIRLRLGEAIRKNSYLESNIIENSKTDFRQHIFNINPSICYSRMLNNFEISTGAEVPLIFVGEFYFNRHDKMASNSINIDYEASVNDRMNGGFIWGLNNFFCIKYFFGKKISIGTEINYGLLSATLGNKRNITEEYFVPFQPTTVTQYKMKYKDVFFSSPEFSFGVNYRF